MSAVVSINELKRIGVATIDKHLNNANEIIVTSHGKNKYALVRYQDLIKMQEDLLELTYLKIMKQVNAKESFVETADEHIDWLEKLLSHD